jgi:hypothetical protein
LIDMKISRRAAIMNGKFESTSKNQDESNLNRPKCPLTEGKARLMPILRGAGLSKSFSRFARNSHSFACCTRAMVDGQISLWPPSVFRATVEKGAARRLRFGEPFQRDLGRPASPAKICRFPSIRIEGYFNAVLFRQEGRIARRHERGTGCGGRRSVRREALFAGRLSVSEHSAQDERR